jgi:lipopolysaccharide heptosyltransferase I
MKTEQPLRTTKASILIVLMGSLGDVARGLGIVDHLKSNCPGCHITWLVEPVCAELVGLHPEIDDIIVFRRAWSLKSLRDLYRQLRRYHFDITLDLQRHFKSGLFSRLSRAKRRIGFHRRNAKEFNWLFNNEHIGYYDNDTPKLDHYFKFTEHLGLADPLEVNFGFANWDARKFLPRVLRDINGPYVSVVLGSRWESKNWHQQGYLRLLQHLLSDEALNVALIGDASQRTAAGEIAGKLKVTPLVNLVGKTSLVELTAVLKCATAVVGPDSGPGHLAAAVGTPYIGLFGPTSPKRTAPYGCENFVVQAQLDCIPCYRKQCPLGTDACMQAIRIETVKEKLAALMPA